MLGADGFLSGVDSAIIFIVPAAKGAAKSEITAISIVFPKSAAKAFAPPLNGTYVVDAPSFLNAASIAIWGPPFCPAVDHLSLPGFAFAKDIISSKDFHLLPLLKITGIGLETN